MAYVSDRFIIDDPRYLERGEGIDIEAVRRKLTADGVDIAAALVRLGDGTRLKLAGGVVSTVLEAGKLKHRRRDFY